MPPSSSSSEKKKVKKDKKDRKEKKEKKDRKDKKPKKKDEEKERKRAERAESWNCERGDAVRQIGALLQLDAAVEEELDGVFEAIDDGETVRIDGLQNKQARKKLRHLLQAFRLTQEDNGQAYRSCELKVSFKSIYQECLGRAKEHFAAKPVEEPPDPEPEPTEPAEPEPFDPRAGFSGEAEAPVEETPRIRGPQLPGATVGAFGGDSGSESDGEAGPRGEGEEREGVDLRYVDPKKSGREEWMTMAPESMAGLFMDGNGMIRKKKADVFAVKRSKEEQEAFEKAFKERGPSLLSQQQQGAFAEAKDAQDSMRKRKVGTSDIWGMSTKDQEKQAAGAPPTRRKSFDPEKDLVTSKPISSDEFSKLVENSQSGLSGRFSRGGVASSFL